MGKFSGAVLIADEITDIFRKEYLTDGLDSLTKTAGIEVFFTDLKLNVTYVSASLCDFLGKSSDGLIGQNTRKIFDVASFKKIAEQGVSFAKKNLRWSDSVKFSVKGDGLTERKLEVSGLSDINGKLSGYIFLLASEN
jgi:PAS domain-containing protein